MRPGTAPGRKALFYIFSIRSAPIGGFAAMRRQRCPDRGSRRTKPMTAPYYINEDQSDIRGIKNGWYVMDVDGNLTSGPFSGPDECICSVDRPTNTLLMSIRSPRWWHRNNSAAPREAAMDRFQIGRAHV